MILFICGVHGVGKTFLCNRIHAIYGIQYYTASELIKAIGNVNYSKSKYVASQSLNEKYLITAIQKIKDSNGDNEIIIDGHLCLLDYKGNVSRLKMETITAIMPDYIILLTEKPDIIAMRRHQRDGVNQSAIDIQTLQSEELKYAKEISMKMGIPILILEGSDNCEKNCETIVKLCTLSHK